MRSPTPLPKPASFSHIDPYPNFGVWNWEVVSDRRWPAFTVLENVSRSGFRSAVREWVPAGAALPNVKLTITSPRLYNASTVYPVHLHPPARWFSAEGDAEIRCAAAG